MKDLAQVLTDYCGNIKLHSVNLCRYGTRLCSTVPKRNDHPDTAIHVKIAQRIARETGSLMADHGRKSRAGGGQTAGSTE